MLRSFHSLSGMHFQCAPCKDVRYRVNYETFFKNLETFGWKTQGKSFAFFDVDHDWQFAFIRLGGRLHRSGYIGFVVCARHQQNRNLDGEVSSENKEPHSYPYKFTFDEIEQNDFEYKCKLENYNLTYLPEDSGWEIFEDALRNTLLNWISGHSVSKLRNEIERNGEGGYIEKMWIEDLQGTA